MYHIHLTLRKILVGDLNRDCHIVPPPSCSIVLSTAKTVSPGVDVFLYLSGGTLLDCNNK